MSDRHVQTRDLVVGPVEPHEEAAWDAYVDAHERGTLYHKIVWRRLVAGLFDPETHYLVARGRERNIAGVLPMVRLKSLLFGDFLVSVPYVNYGGAIGNSPDAEQALMECAADLGRRLGIDHIECRDTLGRPGLDWPVRTDKAILKLALPSSAEELFRALGSKLRAQVRRPLKEGATVLHGGGELLNDFYSVFARNMRDLGTPVYPRQFFRAILSTFPEAASITVVRLANRPVAAGFLLSHRGTLEIPWASSLREYNHLSVNMLLYWESLRRATETGHQAFDFGRSTRDSGTYRFKRQWGAEPLPCHWHYWLSRHTDLPHLSPGNPKYRAALWLWQRFPVFLANLVGPHIVRHLP